MTGPLFDEMLLPLRRQRAARMQGNAFLHERAFADCLERIAAVHRDFSSCLIVGHAQPSWPERLAALGIGQVCVVEPGSDAVLPDEPDLCLTVGALDTAEPLPALLAALRMTLAPDGLFIGAFAGGNSLPALRTAMLAADQATGGAAARVHPPIAAPAFAALLAAAGFAMPVVDVDRVRLRYGAFDALVRDLRGMAATNRLLARSRRPIPRPGRDAARAAFAALAVDGRTTETVEIIHFAAWAPGGRSASDQPGGRRLIGN